MRYHKLWPALLVDKITKIISETPVIFSGVCGMGCVCRSIPSFLFPLTLLNVNCIVSDRYGVRRTAGPVLPSRCLLFSQLLPCPTPDNFCQVQQPNPQPWQLPPHHLWYVHTQILILFFDMYKVRAQAQYYANIFHHSV